MVGGLMVRTVETDGRARRRARGAWARLAAAVLAAVALAMTLLALPAPALASAVDDYDDVVAGEWYVTEGWVDYATSAGIMTGYTYADGSSQRKFGPEDQITRGQAVTILYRIANPGSTDTTDPSQFLESTGFADSNGPQYYNAAVVWAAGLGIVTGYTSGPDAGKFCPDNPITRDELAVIVYRYAKTRGVTVDRPNLESFNQLADRELFYAGQTSNFAFDAVKWVTSAGIMTGNKHGDDAPTFEPRATASRAQAAKVFSVLHRDVESAAPAAQFDYIIIEEMPDTPQGTWLSQEGVRYFGAGAYITGYHGSDGVARIPERAGGRIVVYADLSDSGLTAVDASQDWQRLVYLNVSSSEDSATPNRIESLDLSDMLNLARLDARGAGLSSVDLSGSNAVSYVDVRDNALTTLDLRDAFYVSEQTVFTDGNPGIEVLWPGKVELELLVGEDMSVAYTGQPVDFVFAPPYDVDPASISVSYATEAGEPLTGAPTEPGTYLATLTRTEDAHYLAYSATFTITILPLEPQVPAGLEYYTVTGATDGQPHELGELGVQLNVVEAGGQQHTTFGTYWGEGVYVGGYTGSDPVLVIPGQIGGAPVVSVDLMGAWLTTPLTSIDLTAAGDLRYLSLWDMGLAELDLTGNPALMELSARMNAFDELDLSGNPELRKLDLMANPTLTTVDLSHNPLLASDADNVLVDWGTQVIWAQDAQAAAEEQPVAGDQPEGGDATAGGQPEGEATTEQPVDEPAAEPGAEGVPTDQEAIEDASADQAIDDALAGQEADAAPTEQADTSAEPLAEEVSLHA